MIALSAAATSSDCPPIENIDVDSGGGCIARTSTTGGAGWPSGKGEGAVLDEEGAVDMVIDMSTPPTPG